MLRKMSTKEVWWTIGVGFLFLAFGGFSGLAAYIGVIILTELLYKWYTEKRSTHDRDNSR